MAEKVCPGQSGSDTGRAGKARLLPELPAVRASPSSCPTWKNCNWVEIWWTGQVIELVAFPRTLSHFRPSPGALLLVRKLRFNIGGRSVESQQACKRDGLMFGTFCSATVGSVFGHWAEWVVVKFVGKVG